ncbi:MAG: primosomal protein N' [Armatimonadetes bacterium]|nr:primosomal protein N' [Armatimonadota bacterium]
MPFRQFATVYVDSPAVLLDKSLTYEVPPRLQESVSLGSYVLVPLRNDCVPGFVVSLSEKSDVESAKPISDLLADIPFFNRELLRLATWIAKYYHSSMVDALRCLIPGGLRQRVDRFYAIAAPAETEAYLAASPRRSPARTAILRLLLSSTKPLTLADIKEQTELTRAQPVLKDLIKKGWVSQETRTVQSGMNRRYLKAVQIAPDERPRSLDDREKKVYEAVQAAGGRLELKVMRQQGLSPAAIKRLLAQGLLLDTEIASLRTPASLQAGTETSHILTDEQEQAIATICEQMKSAQDQRSGPIGQKTAPMPCLLHGITASGKTEVYLRAIERCLHLGRQAIVLVPEIALTEQTLGLFRRRFGDQVAVFHSALSQGERFDEWDRARRGEARIVVGARSAVFAPLQNVGLIVIDEEHDASYKQENSPRYHARDAALRRAEIEGSMVVLGSATPSPESYRRADTSKYRLVRMTRRVASRSLPTVEIVDLRQAQKELKQFPVLSPQLRQALDERLLRNEQTILFLNRRGFCSVIQCHSCGRVESCPRCSVALTYHQNARLLRCHHCNSARSAPTLCANCGAPLTSYLGVGTQRVEAEVAELFPGARLLRMDRDTTTRKGSHVAMLGAFRLLDADVLIGTQMVAKGLDFPKVTLVGVVLADTALHVPDFRAAERTFQLLAQVSGRAGRGEDPGHVIIQTYQPDNYAIMNAARLDYAGFWKHELRLRRELPYPPFTHLVNIVSASPVECEARSKAQAVKEALMGEIQKQGGTQLIGPAPCPLAQVKDQFRWHLLLRDRSKPRLHQVLERTLDQWSPSQRQGLTIDVDPMALM